MAAPTTCTIRGEVYHVDGTPAANVAVSVRVVPADGNGAGQIVQGAGITNEEVSVFTDDHGSFTVALVQGARIDLRIAAIHLRQTISVPREAGPVDVVSLI